ncbi:MAG: BON domain-containing protein [Chlamydiia bacterium]|nr:BON domain-containing protein [Chlamydiia bacterium]
MKTLLALSLVLAASLSAAGQSSRVPQPTHVAELNAQMDSAQANTKYPLDTAKTFKDKELNNKIRTKIEGWFADDYRGVILKTDNGIVVISGNIESDDLSNDLAEQVRKMEGVRQVRNKLQTNTNK